MTSRMRAIAVSVALACMAGTLFAQQQQPIATIATVVKVKGIAWFNRMEEGVKAFGEANKGVKTFQAGPAEADAVQQLRVVEEMVAQRVAAIAVVPVDPSALEAVLKRALDQGIKVVTHEADNQKNSHADIEAFDNTEFGARLNERLAACMAGRGKWTTFVGSRASQTHLQWAGGGTANAARNHPSMVLVDPLNESSDDAATAYEKARDILRRHPDIRGFQGASSRDALGIGRAIEEAGLQDKTCVFGTGLPSQVATLLASGAIDGISFWDPKDAGVVMNKVALMLIEGKAISDGANLGVKGYEKVKVSKGAGKGVVIKGQAWAEVDKLNAGAYPF